MTKKICVNFFVLRSKHTGFVRIRRKRILLLKIFSFVGMPPQKILDNSKRARNFISSKGHPRYCTATVLGDSTVVLSGGRSRRGKMRGPPASRSWTTALKGCTDEAFIDFLKRCLDWDADSRLTPPLALKHTWLRKKMLPQPPDSSSVTPSSQKSIRHPSTYHGTTTNMTNSDGVSASSRAIKLPLI